MAAAAGGLVRANLTYVPSVGVLYAYASATGLTKTRVYEIGCILRSEPGGSWSSCGAVTVRKTTYGTTSTGGTCPFPGTLWHEYAALKSAGKLVSEDDRWVAV